MRLSTSATQIDFYPQSSAGKFFVRRVIWHPGSESEMITFGTVSKSDMVYDVNNHIANGATVTDFNLNSYDGKDYSPLAC